MSNTYPKRRKLSDNDGINELKATTLKAPPLLSSSKEKGVKEEGSMMSSIFGVGTSHNSRNISKSEDTGGVSSSERSDCNCLFEKKSSSLSLSLFHPIRSDEYKDAILRRWNENKKIMRNNTNTKDCNSSRDDDYDVKNQVESDEGEISEESNRIFGNGGDDDDDGGFRESITNPVHKTSENKYPREGNILPSGHTQRESILTIRRMRACNDKCIELTNCVKFDLSTLFPELEFSEQDQLLKKPLNTYTTQDGSDCNFRKKMIDEDLHGATRFVSSIIRQMGVCFIQSSFSNKSMMSGIFPPDLLKELSLKSKCIEKKVCHRLDQLKQEWRSPSPTVGAGTGTENDGTSSATIFQYHEVASRCRGRLDVRYGTNEAPFDNPHVVRNKILIPIVHELLGNDATLLYIGLIYSFPNSSDQPWHTDGTILFPEFLSRSSSSSSSGSSGTTTSKNYSIHHLPPYALNVFVPLDKNITEEIGPTEFVPRSHFSKKAKAIDEELCPDNFDGKKGPTAVRSILDPNDAVAPLLKVGEALIYDYRVCHRGTANLSADTRTMLYMIFARPWFKEHLNFGAQKLFEDKKHMP